MAYTADTLAYDVISEMGPRELKGAVWLLGQKYILPRGEFAAVWVGNVMCPYWLLLVIAVWYLCRKRRLDK